MRKYTEEIEKLYESEKGFCTIEVGKTYEGKNGNKLSIKKIWINANSNKPCVEVEYNYETSEGKKGSEKNMFETVVEMLREK